MSTVRLGRGASDGGESRSVLDRRETLNACNADRVRDLLAALGHRARAQRVGARRHGRAARARAAVQQELAASADFAEGVHAFAARRRPEFGGA